VPNDVVKDVGAEGAGILSDKGPTAVPTSGGADPVILVAALVNPETLNSDLLGLDTRANQEVRATAALGQYFQGVAESRLAPGILPTLPAKFDAALVPLLEPVPVPPVFTVPPTSFDALRLDESSDLPDWLPGMARAVLYRVVLNREIEAQVLADRDNPSNADIFSGEDSASWGTSAEDPDQTP
jgi:hypothetical protein